jgi:hypothetical protein
MNTIRGIAAILNILFSNKINNEKPKCNNLIDIVLI